MSRLVGIFLVATQCWVGAAFAGEALQEQTEAGNKVKVQTLMKTTQSWDGVAYENYSSGRPELSILKIEIPPNTTLPWHTHPMPNAAYVVNGTLTVETESGRKLILAKGDTLPETVDTVHRGTSGSEAVELIVFYAGVKGQPLNGPGH
ncbi:MAG TPA: cupin [Pusillimonas sp.]|nr:cupin [Pusillimonas sp.]